MPKRLPKIFTAFIVEYFGEDMLKTLAEEIFAMQGTGSIENNIDTIMIDSIHILAQKTGKTAPSIFYLFGESILPRLLEDYQTLYLHENNIRRIQQPSATVV